MLGTPLGRILLDRPAWTYLLGPFFKASTPDQAAPLSATYREAGAVGALTVVDTGNNLSVSGGTLNLAARVSNADPSLVAVSTLTRTAGRVLLVRHTNTGSVAGGFVAVGWGNGASTSALARWAVTPTSTLVYENGTFVTLPALTGWGVGVAYDLAVVLRGTGAAFLARAAGDGVYTVWWVGNGNSVSPLAPVVSIPTTAIPTSLANLRVANLGGAWASDYGIATDRKATSAATDTITHTANGLIEHTITAATGVTQELWVRRTDASNGWIVRMSQAGSTIKLIELVANIETERASSAQTWTNGTAYRVVVICDGQTITPYVANVAKTGYASASTNQSATTAYVDTAGADLVSWPRVVSLPIGV